MGSHDDKQFFKDGLVYSLIYIVKCKVQRFLQHEALAIASGHTNFYSPVMDVIRQDKMDFDSSIPLLENFTKVIQTQFTEHGHHNPSPSYEKSLEMDYRYLQ